MKRSARVEVPLTEDERRALERETQRLGMTMAGWIRHIIRPLIGLDVARDIGEA